MATARLHLDSSKVVPLAVDQFVIVGVTGMAAVAAIARVDGSLASAATVTALLAGWSSAWSP